MQQNLQKKVELASLKSEIDKIDVDKLETIPTDLNKLNDIVDKNTAKKICLTNYLKNLILIILRCLPMDWFLKYDSNKQSLEKKINKVKNRYLTLVKLLTPTILKD